MARYQVQAPDGSMHVIEGPDGATPAQVMAQAQQLLGPAMEDQTRANLASGATLKIGPYDTGIALPQAVTEGLAGMGRRFMDIGTFGNRSTRDEQADKALNASGYATAGAAGADLATMLGGGALLRGAAAVPQLISTAPRIAGALDTAGTALMAPTSIPQAGIAGGLYGAATTDGSIKDRALAGGLGAAAGVAGQAIPNAIARVIAPQGSADINALRAAGVDLTPGQALGDFASRMEQKMQSLPVVGDLIMNARRGSIGDFNKAAANEALAPLGVTVPDDVKPGRDLINFAAQALSDAYDKVVPQLTVKADPGLQGDLSSALQTAAQAGKQDQFRQVVQNQIIDKMQNGTLAGEDLKGAESELKRLARGYSSSPSQDERSLGGAIMDARDGLMDAASRYSPPQAVQDLANADSAFARMVRVQGAAGMQGAKEGVFTPAQFLSQVRAQSGGVRKSQYAQGNALMQDIGQSAENVLGSTVPDSGTAGRLLMNAGVIGAAGGAAGATGFVQEHPYLSAALLAAGGAYTPAGRSIINTLITPRSSYNALAASDAMRELAPYLSGPAVSAPAAAAAMNARQ